MKVSYAQDNVKASQGIKESAGFQIAATAQAFEILSSGLYSDKIRAVLREIGCNAMDAHIAAGDPNKPFRVKIPNSLDDQFYVQDWGLGLSHEEVMKLYSTYFASTKQSSDAFTGAFGLGSKSPFSYTGQFYVTSTHGGKKRTYSLYKDNEGTPTVSLMAEEEADKGWKSGMRVGFAVKPEDVDEFASKAVEVFKWFRVAPEMKGVAAIDPVKYEYTCDEFGFLDRDDPEREEGKVHAVMGNVMYPVDLDKLGIMGVDDEKAAKQLINYASVFRGLVLFVPIGGVQVTASREHLEYKPRTVAALKERLLLAVKRASKEAFDALETSASGDWRELCHAKERITQVLGRSSMHWHFMSMCEALGVDKKLAKRLEHFMDNDFIQVNVKHNDELSVYIVKRRQDGSAKASVHSSGYYSRRLVIEPESIVMVSAVPKTQSRAKRAIVDDKHRQILVVARTSKSKMPYSDVAKVAKEIADELGGVPLVDASTYEPMPGDAVSTKKRKPKGWAPFLPIGVLFKAFVGKVKQELELGAPELSETLYACRRKLAKGHDLMRVFSSNVEDDVSTGWHNWIKAWGNIHAVADASKVPGAPGAFAVLDGAAIKSIALPKIGWTNAYDAARAWALNPAIRDELRKHIKKKHLAAPDDIHYIDSDDWMGGLACYLEKTEGVQLAELLDKAQLLDLARSMIVARKKGGDAVIPPAVLAYQEMCEYFEITDTLATDVQSALTVDDANIAFVKRFPRAEMFNVKELINTHTSETLAAVKFVLSKEI